MPPTAVPRYDALEEGSVRRHVQLCMPFLARFPLSELCTAPEEWPTLAFLSKPEVAAQRVEMACSETGRYYGTPEARQAVALRAGHVREYVLAKEAGAPHFLDETELQFYLCQCTIRSTDTSCPVRLHGLEDAVRM